MFLIIKVKIEPHYVIGSTLEFFSEHRLQAYFPFNTEKKYTNSLLF